MVLIFLVPSLVIAIADTLAVALLKSIDRLARLMVPFRYFCLRLFVQKRIISFVCVVSGQYCRSSARNQANVLELHFEISFSS